MDSTTVKQEKPTMDSPPKVSNTNSELPPIDVSSCSSSSSFNGFSSNSSDMADHSSIPNTSQSEILQQKSKNPEGLDVNLLMKKPKVDQDASTLAAPPGFLAPVPVAAHMPPVTNAVPLTVVYDTSRSNVVAPVMCCKQFWKAGDYKGDSNGGVSDSYSGVGMDHVRVHPKFLHSNATSHKWALGAFAELLDNALDEVCYGATYVHVDVVKNRKDGSNMILVEDNGGGMDPNKMRACMSLGYSVKSKMANTIGQYGNGFKTSTMRLGADVIVFSRSKGRDGRSATQSIGMLSYTFLRGTGKEDIVVPMIDYENTENGWRKLVRSSEDDWNRNLASIAHWSPYMSEEVLLQQFNVLRDQGTRIIIYNLWEDDEGNLELDFEADPHDIQIRGASRDEKTIEMAKKYPNSRHFLTYQHSLRSYSSILYLRLPPQFRIILRGKDVEHHNIVNDMMHTKQITYKPTQAARGVPNILNMVAAVTIGFVKDAIFHIDVQGFNVYHKNRLIKPFWRIWNAAGSDGRGVIGVLEANFVEPAHDKQGFERTTVLSRLESKLIAIQKDFWAGNCQKIGYAARRPTKNNNFQENLSLNQEKSSPQTNQKAQASHQKAQASTSGTTNTRSNGNFSMASPVPNQSTPSSAHQLATHSHPEASVGIQLENHNLRARSANVGEPAVADMQNELQSERERSRQLEFQLQVARRKIEELEKKVQQLDKEQATLIDMFVQERTQRDAEEEKLRNRLKTQ